MSCACCLPEHWVAIVANPKSRPIKTVPIGRGDLHASRVYRGFHDFQGRPLGAQLKRKTEHGEECVVGG